MSAEEKIAKKISLSGLVNALKMTDDEMVDAARKSLINKNGLFNIINMDSINERFAQSALKDDTGYKEAFTKLRNAVSAKNEKEVMNVATDISKRFNDNSFLDYINESSDYSKLAKTYYSNPNLYGGSIKYDYMQGVKIPKTLKKIGLNFTDEEKLNELAYKANAAKHYFTSPDKHANKVRAGVAGGTYATAMTGARLLHGGSLTKNEYGERDIVGIPFF